MRVKMVWNLFCSNSRKIITDSWPLNVNGLITLQLLKNTVTDTSIDYLNEVLGCFVSFFFFKSCILALPGTKPQGENFHCWTSGASIPSVETPNITWTRYTRTNTQNVSSSWPYNFNNDNTFSVSVPPTNGDLKKILTDLAALQSPNSIIRAANVCCLAELIISQVNL